MGINGPSPTERMSIDEEECSHCPEIGSTSLYVDESDSGETTGLEVHEVIAPPKRSTFNKLKSRLKEIFFPDDQLRQFKGQSVGRKIVIGAQYIFPVLEWGPKYSFRLLKADIISGITIATLAIPQGISYAQLANLPPIVGLYSSSLPPIVYAILGSSRDLAVGPASISSLILGAMLSEEVSPTQQPLLFLQLAFTSTFLSGCFEASLGLLRLGFLIDFLSKATLLGFMAGSAIIVSLQQLKVLLGIVHFTKKMSLVQVMTSVFQHRDEWSWQTFVMGVFLLLFLLLTRYISMRNPKLFWVSAAAPLTSVIISTVVVYAFEAQKHGISIIGKLPQGLNPLSLDMLNFKGSYLMLSIKTGFIAGLVSLTEGIAVGRTFASLKHYKVDGNKEMMAIGVMNILGSFTSCYITTGTFSRSAVNYNAGSKTAVSNLVMAITIMITLLFLMPLFFYTPNVVLGAIIVTAVIGLVDIQGAILIWKIDKFDFIICLSAFFGVIFSSVQEGLGIAVALSIIKVLLQICRPKTVILGNIPGTNIYRDMHQYKKATKIHGFLIIAVEAFVNFANTTYLAERISQWIEEELVEEDGQKLLHYVVLDMSAITTIDTSGIALLTELKQAADSQGLQLVLVNPLEEVLEKLERVNQSRKFMDAVNLYLTVGEAVGSLSPKVRRHDASSQV